ncbi:GAF domain-containing sensor histidine kinase [Limisalsivibrio acetivorans]|uniref:GAF domain-containing sensor histidine kinase n=1 Tax=Limisalsivibrio acetivorans TaxID=1304888 RepID=UPI0003B3A354|nr:PAS domain S-box protein [Limisalsivibrio acetivorans]
MKSEEERGRRQHIERELECSKMAVSLHRSLNHALADSADDQELLSIICRRAVEICGYSMVWMGFLLELDEKIIIPAASHGDHFSYLDNNSVRLDTSDPSSGPAAICALNEETVIENRIEDSEYLNWRDKALDSGFGSFAAIPISSLGGVSGVLCIYASEKDRFDSFEMQVLEGLMSDLSACLGVIGDREECRILEHKSDIFEQKYNVLFNNSSDAIFVHEFTHDLRNGRFIEVNDEACGKLGYTRDELIGMTPGDLEYPSGKYDINNIRSSLLNNGHCYFEAVMFTKSGSLLPVMVGAHCFSLGEVSYIVSIVRDISERVRIRKQLNLLRNAIEQSTVSVVITNRDGMIEYVNPHFEQTSGYTYEEAVGENPRLLKSGRMEDSVYQELWETIAEGNIWKGELCNKRKDGGLYWESAIIFPVREPGGEIVNYISVKEDITERRILEEQVRHSQRLNLIGEMAGNFAHDLKNIIMVIGGFSARLLKTADEHSAEYEYITHIQKAVQKASKLTNGLLTFARKQPNRPEVQDINVVIKDYEDLLARILDDKIELEMILCDEPVHVYADSVQMEQVLMNIASNAKDAMPDGGKLRVETSLQRAEGSPVCARIVISDNGHGMDPDTARHIFDPFYTTKEPGKGTGLGLSIVYGIVRQHRGNISCESEKGKGTSFTINIPHYTTDDGKECCFGDEG